MWNDFEANERSGINETRNTKPADLITEIMHEWMKASQALKVDRLERNLQNIGDQSLAQFPSDNTLLKQLGILRAESVPLEANAKGDRSKIPADPSNVTETEVEVVASRNQLPKGITLDREASAADKVGRSRMGDVLSVTPSDNSSSPIKVVLTHDERGQLSYSISDPGRTTHGRSQIIRDGRADVELRDGTTVKIENGRISAVRHCNEQYNIRDRKGS